MDPDIINVRFALSLNIFPSLTSASDKGNLFDGRHGLRGFTFEKILLKELVSSSSMREETIFSCSITGAN